jgi:peptidoglycan/xylan/chitin deacetylase (PgdA/CDA1 family)
LLEDLLLKENKISFNYQDQTMRYSLQSYSEKEEVFNTLRHFIKAHHGTEQFNLIDSLFSTYGMLLHEKVEQLALDWNQISQLNKDPLVTIAAHTVSHPSFKVISEAELLNEVERSIEILETKLHTPIGHFAYPYGSAVEVGKREVDLMSKTKIKTSTTGRNGNIMREHFNNLHALPRLYVGPETSERYLVNFINGRIPFITGAKQRVVTV